MRIVYVSPVGFLGGAEQSLLNCMAALRQGESASSLHLLAGAEGPLTEAARAIGVSTTTLPMAGEVAELGESILGRSRRPAAVLRLAGRTAAAIPAARRYLGQLRHTLRRLRPDVIHSNGLKCHLLTSLAGPGLAPLVWHMHDFLGTRRMMGRALRLAARRAAGVIAISQAVARDTAGVLPRTPVEVVYNAIDVRRFCPGSPDDAFRDGKRLDELAGLPRAEPGVLRVGLVATYARWKGQELLLEAAARLFADRPDWPLRFFIVGGPIYSTQGSQFSERDLRAKAAALGLSGRVGFVGFQRQTDAVYRGLDLVIHASTNPEPFGMTIVEAMACGRPVIVANAGGAAELFTHDHDAVGVPPGDAAALARAVAELAADAPRRDRLGRNARRGAELRFSRDRLGPQMLAAYRRFLGTGGGTIDGREELLDLPGRDAPLAEAAFGATVGRVSA